MNSDDPVKWRADVANKWLANDVINKGGFVGNTDLTRVKLDPAVKDKLVTDEARLRKLKEDQERLMRQALPEIEELETMQRKLGKQDPRPVVEERAPGSRGRGGGVLGRSAAQNMGIDDPFQPPKTPPVGNEDPMVSKLRQLRE